VTAAGQRRSPLPLSDDIDDIAVRVASASHVGLFLDFDGTIAPIVPNPTSAEIDSEIHSILNRLAAWPELTLSIVSGRALADLRGRVGIRDAIYVGNHGLEIESDSIQFRHPDAETRQPDLRSLLILLRGALVGIEGAEVEDKGLTASVHFRRVAPDERERVRGTTLRTVAGSPSFTYREGKMVVEVRPRVDWHKGCAVKWIRTNILPSYSLPIYMGDDTTDEDAFGVLPEGITVKVGQPGSTRAQYWLPDVPEVGQFLARLVRSN
jgi:trehalose 6-phosphate phosphatase